MKKLLLTALVTVLFLASALYAYAPAGVTVQLTSTAILSARDVTTTSQRRQGFAVVNAGSYPVYVALWTNAVASKGIYLAPNGGALFMSQNVYEGAISAIAVGGTSIVTVQEW